MQNIISDLKKTFASTANMAVKKSNELLEISKITLAITGVQNDIEREYSSIGKMIYDGYKTNDVSTADVTARCAIIEAKILEIQELREKLAIVKNVKTCPVCSAEVSANSTFCAKCGEKL